MIHLHSPLPFARSCDNHDYAACMVHPAPSRAGSPTGKIRQYQSAPPTCEPSHRARAEHPITKMLKHSRNFEHLPPILEGKRRLRRARTTPRHAPKQFGTAIALSLTPQKENRAATPRARDRQSKRTAYHERRTRVGSNARTIIGCSRNADCAGSACARYDSVSSLLGLPANLRWMESRSMIDSQLFGSSPVRVIFGSHALAQLGNAVGELQARRALIVTDRSIRAAGYLGRAVHYLHECFIETVVFDGAEQNPDTDTVARGLDAAKSAPPDLIVGLGGGSAMDCAKAINLLHCCGGQMSDYRGDPPPATLAARPPLLPMVLVPTTAGTGSEAQSFAIIADAATHMKMPCGDRRAIGGLRPRVAILDPVLTDTVPPRIAAATGIDAITHAVETAGCRVRTEASRQFSIEAWRRLATAFPLVMSDPHNEAARGDMLIGAHLAGCAIENSMLGAAHACANPLTAKYDIAHGVAVGVMLPHVIRFNARDGQENPYAALDRSPARLAATIESLLDAGEIRRRLRDFGVEANALPALAEQAAAQWTAGFNPVAVGPAEMRVLYEAAF